jgi:putative sugar O-methyltransferase
MGTDQAEAVGDNAVGDDHENLRLMLADMERAPEEFRPTNFWRRGLQPILDDIETHGFETFRAHRSAQGFYVPGYARPEYRANRDRIERVLGLLPDRRAHSVRWRLDGRQLAWSDARLVAATDTEGGLDIATVSESPVGGGELHHVHGRTVTRSLLNYSRAITLLKATVDTSDLSSVLEIGGGYGTLGEILLTARPDDGFFVNVDIPPVAAVSTYYLSEVFGREAVLGYSASRDMDSLDLDELRQHYRAVVLCPWQLPSVRGSVDMFANFMSFQEMEPPVVSRYCGLVGPLTERFVLLRNSATGKQRVSEGQLGVLEPVTTDFVVEQLASFDERARDSFVHGDESPDRSFRSEVVVLERTAAR